MVFADAGEPYADASLQILLALLFHQSNADTPNVFLEFAAALSRPEDYEVLFQSLMRLLRNPAYASNSWMPASTKEIECHQELLLLFWKLLEVNDGFRGYVCQQAPVLLAQLCDTLLYFVREYYSIPGQSGLVYLCVFLLLLLSSERDFALALNEPFAGKMPTGWPVLTAAKGAAKRAAAALAATQTAVDASARAAERRRKAIAGVNTDNTGGVSDEVRTVQGDGFATYADYLIIVFHRLFSELKSHELSPLLEPMCTVLANVSPYIKHLTTVASVALVKLLERFSKPTFLFAAEFNHRILGYFLEAFNNMLQYQANSHHRLVYAAVFKKELIEALGSLTFDKGMEALGDTPTGDWKPSEDWFKDWHEKLPMTPMERMIEAIVPRMTAAQEKNAAAGLSPLSEQQMMAVVQRDSLVGILPVPHPILLRRYEPNDHTAAWFSSFFWGLVFRRALQPPMFLSSSAQIKLFTVVKAPGMPEATPEAKAEAKAALESKTEEAAAGSKTEEAAAGSTEEKK
jgi:Dyggve-Melchior-Clausen syndrome protein